MYLVSKKVIGTFEELGLRCLLEVLPAEGSLVQDHHVNQCASLLPSKNNKPITLLYVSHQNMSQFIQQVAEIVKESILDWKPRGCGDADCRVSGRSSISRGGNPQFSKLQDISTMRLPSSTTCKSEAGVSGLSKYVQHSDGNGRVFPVRETSCFRSPIPISRARNLCNRYHLSVYDSKENMTASCVRGDSRHGFDNNVEVFDRWG